MVELKARERTLLSEESVYMKAVNKTIDEQTDLTNKMQQRRQFARRDGFHRKSGHRGAGGQGHAGGKGMGRGYRGI